MKQRTATHQMATRNQAGNFSKPMRHDRSSHFGLGYIKKQAASIGNTVTIGEDIDGIVAEVPYLSRQHPPSTNPSS